MIEISRSCRCTCPCPCACSPISLPASVAEKPSGMRSFSLLDAGAGGQASPASLVSAARRPDFQQRGFREDLLAGTASGADDDIQAARACPAGKGLRLDAELTRQPQRHPLAARREVDGRLRVREARRAA